MRSRLAFLCATILMVGVVSGCGTEELYSEVVAGADNFNAEVAAYNKEAVQYNEAVDVVKAENRLLTVELSNAQKAINDDGAPYDGMTLTNLKNAMAAAESARVQEPVILQEEQLIEPSDEMSRDELSDIKQEIEERTAALSEMTVPDAPVKPEYSAVIEELKEATQAYQASVQSLKQITAPSDEFVIERLRGIDSITKIEAVTEDRDPNGQLNKQGGYIGCIYFRDKRVGAADLYLESGEEDVIEIGTVGGGAVEIFATPEEAEARNQYLSGFDGAGAFSSGSHQVEGTVIIRTSDNLTATQQKKLTKKITSALIAVK